ncbi:hypothetical protein DB43_HM00030 [Parachlamydia acanthamoebae]|uniref:Transposase IS4-like domain-containing protein n=1 Tax=Parachlamydia acanthamoebae TaxID=83552 RepID=A0A0C1C6C0_9BACT|nr:hypothetical protein DB43_HM00030 [Parachlamydia acanthamoebae]
MVTNDLDSDADRIYEVYQKRRRIEEYHKSIKQNASLEKSPTKVVRAQKNHIFASIVSFCKLEFLKIRTSLNHFALKYKLILIANQMAFRELKILREKAMSGRGRNIPRSDPYVQNYRIRLFPQIVTPNRSLGYL